MLVISDTSPLTALLLAGREELLRGLFTRVAFEHGLLVTGLLGLMVLAKQRALISEIVPVIVELQNKGNCWFGNSLLAEVCHSVGEDWTI